MKHPVPHRSILPITFGLVLFPHRLRKKGSPGRARWSLGGLPFRLAYSAPSEGFFWRRHLAGTAFPLRSPLGAGHAAPCAPALADSL